MSVKDVRELLKTIVTSDMTGGTKGGLMLPEQADRFIDLTLDYTSMLKVIRNEKKVAATGEIDTLNIGSVVTEGAAEEPGEGVSPAEEVKPTFGKIVYTMKKLRSMFDLGTDALLNNIEHERQLIEQRGDAPSVDFRETLMRAYAKRIGSDIELLAIKGNETITDTSLKVNRLLKSNNGYDVLTDTGTHLVDAGMKNVSAALFAAMLEAIPSPYLNRMQDLRWFMGVRANIRWTKEIVARQTALGDEALTGGKAAPFGIPIVLVPLIPENKTASVGTLSYNNLSFIWLTFPENFIITLRRAVETYWEFVPRRDKWENTTYSETDMLIENPDAIVKAYNVKVDATEVYV